MHTCVTAMGRGKRQRYFTEAASSQLSLSYSSDRRLIPRIKEVSTVSTNNVAFSVRFTLCSSIFHRTETAGS